MEVRITTPLPATGTGSDTKRAAPAPQVRRSEPQADVNAGAKSGDLKIAASDLSEMLGRLHASEPSAASGRRLEIDIDEAAGQVYGRVVDRDTGEEITEIPSKEMRALMARARELLGPLFDVKA